MSPERRPIGRELAQLVEKQLRNWEIARAQKAHTPARQQKSVADFVVLSRAVGLPAHEVAANLHEKLGWPLFDKQILVTMAGDDDYRRRLYANMDGRDLSWLESFARGLSVGRSDKDDYFHRLTATVLSIARQGHAIFVGRAAHLILPKNVGLKARLTASRDFCLQGYAAQKGLSVEEALPRVEEIEDERARFVRNHFGVELEDETTHDLIINMERFSTEEAASLIMSALRTGGMISEDSPKP